MEIAPQGGPPDLDSHPLPRSVRNTKSLNVDQLVLPGRGRRSAWLGRQIVNLEVAGSNPVGPAIRIS